jgi:hypothetical protein
MALTKVVLRLARNEGYPDGDHEQGYVITAPLDRDGRIDLAEWRENKAACVVIRFKPGEAKDADGRLTHHGGKWMFHYDEAREGADEPVYRLGDHDLSLGSYLTIHESDGQDLTYRVTEHSAVHNASATS